MVCNLTPAVGDVDMGETGSFAFPKRNTGETFEVDVSINTGETIWTAAAVGAVDIFIYYDATAH